MGKSSYSLVAAGVILVLTAGLLAAAGKKAPPPPKDWNARLAELKEEVGILAVLCQLDLKEDQIRLLLTSAYYARKARDDHEVTAKKLAPLFEDACRDLHREDAAYRGLTKKVMSRAGRTEHKIKLANKAFYDRMNVQEAKVEAMLTPMQKALLAQLRAGTDVRTLIRSLEADGKRRRTLSRALRGRHRVLAAVLGRIRSYSDEEWTRDAGEIAARFVRGFRDYNRPLSQEEQEDYHRHLLNIFTDVRAMKEEVFETSLETIAKKIRPPDRVKEIQKEMKEISKAKYGGMGILGRFLLLERLIPVLELRIGLAPGLGAPKGLQVSGPRKKESG